MVRAACCDKMGLKKGPWSPDEDEILVTYIQRHGHGNWRALPKQAGLLRCGKSCRLRWINYLRPDIKRGNFSMEEKETIMKLHRIVGNRWSAIAAKLPGRTDNEIKNYWHTHLKKRVSQKSEATPTTIESQSCTVETKIISHHHLVNFTAMQYGSNTSPIGAPVFPQGYSCQEVVSDSTAKIEPTNCSNNTGDDMMFWYDLLMKAGNSVEILESMRMFG